MTKWSIIVFPNLSFHHRGICSVSIKNTWILRILEMPRLKAGTLDTESCWRFQGTANWEEQCPQRSTVAEQSSLTGSLFIPCLFDCYPIPNKKDFKTFKAARILILRLSCHTQDISVSKLVKYANGIWKLFFPPFCCPLMKVFSLIQAELLFLTPTLSF